MRGWDFSLGGGGDARWDSLCDGGRSRSFRSFWHGGKPLYLGPLLETLELGLH